MSRGPTLTTIVRRALAGEAALPRGRALVIAVSGGPDSMALLHALALLARRTDLELHAHGVDHGLRPEASAELDLAADVARSAGVGFDRTNVVVPRGPNLQARARALRWEALIEAARRRGAAIATAHHADDRAETVLLRVLRGAGLRGLGVLPPRAVAPGAPDVPLIRPLIRARRADVIAHLERNGIPCASDPSNLEPRFLRVRIRAHLLPLMAELDPAIVDHLTALADELSSPEPVGDGASDRSRADRPLDLMRADPLHWTASLPRPTQIALQTLVRSRSREARVWLPGGLVAALASEARAGRARTRPRRASEPSAHAHLPAGKPNG